MVSPGGYDIFLRSSTDGFASDLATFDIADSANGGLITLDGSSLTSVTNATEFRIYAIAPTGTGGNRWFDLVGSDTDTSFGLVVNGTVMIPEPSTSLLGAFACIALATRRRR